MSIVGIENVLVNMSVYMFAHVNDHRAVWTAFNWHFPHLFSRSSFL